MQTESNLLNQNSQRNKSASPNLKLVIIIASTILLGLYSGHESFVNFNLPNMSVHSAKRAIKNHFAEEKKLTRSEIATLAKSVRNQHIKATKQQLMTRFRKIDPQIPDKNLLELVDAEMEKQYIKMKLKDGIDQGIKNILKMKGNL